MAVGPFTEADAIPLESLETLGHIPPDFEGLLPVETALVDIPALAVTGSEAASLRQGQVYGPPTSSPPTSGPIVSPAVAWPGAARAGHAVFTGPGVSAVRRTPSPAVSAAIASVREITYALLA